MKRTAWNRIVSVLIAAALLVSAIPMNAYAEEETPAEAEVTPVVEQPGEDGGEDEKNIEPPNSEEQEPEESKEGAEEPPAEEIGPEESENDVSEDDAAEDDTAQSEEASRENDPSNKANEEMDVGLAALLSEEGINSLDALVALAGKTDAAGVSLEELDENRKKITVDAGGLILLSNTDVDFSGYTIYLSTISGSYEDLTKTITITETSTDENGEETTTSKEYTFQGLGSENHPFSGTLESQDGSYGVILNVPFFGMLIFQTRNARVLTR